MAKILIVSPPTDAHAMVVGWSLKQRGHHVTFWDTGEAMQGRGFSVELGPKADTRIDIGGVSDFDAAWLRRVHWTSRYSLSTAKDDQKYISEENRKFLDNVLERFDGSSMRWVNSRRPTLLGEMKVEQLHACRELGINFPETLISSDPVVIRSFVKRVGRVAVKPIDVFTWTLDDGAQLMTYTSTMDAESLRGISDEALAACPVIYQAFVDKVCDLRVVAIKDEVFCCRIESQPGTTDFRPFQGEDVLKIDRFPTPDVIRVAMLSLLRRFNLQMASSDFVLDASGNIHFLDLNPGGAFLFAEFHTGYPIAAHVAAALAGESPDGYESLAEFNAAATLEARIGAV